VENAKKQAFCLKKLSNAKMQIFQGQNAGALTP
jgi:hypothetical protein